MSPPTSSNTTDAPHEYLYQTGSRRACRAACTSLGTAATKMVEAGTSESTMLAIMGHMSRPMLERYSHIRMAAKRVAVKSLSLPDRTKETPISDGVSESSKAKRAGCPKLAPCVKSRMLPIAPEPIRPAQGMQAPVRRRCLPRGRPGLGRSCCHLQDLH